MTKSNSNTTPTPWEFAEPYVSAGSVTGQYSQDIIGYQSDDPLSGYCVARFWFGNHRPEQNQQTDKANAALIIQAVNAHDSLIAALRDIQGVGHVSVHPANAQQWKAALERANDKLEQVMEWARNALNLADGSLAESDPEPNIDDSVKACPECETPNQFGEVCDRCRREIQDEGRTDLEVD